MQMTSPEVFDLSHDTHVTRDHVGSRARTLQINCWRRGTDSAGASCRTLRKLRSGTTDEPEPYTVRFHKLSSPRSGPYSRAWSVVSVRGKGSQAYAESSADSSYEMMRQYVLIAFCMSCGFAAVPEA